MKYVLYKWCSRKRQSRHASCNKSAFNVMIYPRYLDRHLIAASCAGGQRWMLNVTSGLLSASLPLMRLGNFLFQVSVILISIPLLLLPTFSFSKNIIEFEIRAIRERFTSDQYKIWCVSIMLSIAYQKRSPCTKKKIKWALYKEKNRSTTLKVRQHVLKNSIGWRASALKTA